MTKYGRSPWVDRFPASRVPAYPQQRGSVEVPVAIVGGGLTGCATAYAFAAAGVKPVLLESARIGRGSTGSGVGWISDEPGASFIEVEQALGVRAARSAFRAWRRAALDLAALLRRLDVKCYLQSQPAATVAITPEEASRLRREQKVRTNAGLTTPGLNAGAIRAAFGVEAMAGARQPAGSVLDPYRACLGLAAAAAERGAVIFERSPVRRITFDRKIAQVFTADGSIRVRRVVIATGAPTALAASLARHFRYRASYLALTEPVPAKIRSRLGSRTLVLQDAADPSHVVRWVDDERLLVCGCDREALPPRQRSKVVVQRTGQLMYELSRLYPDISGILPAYGWDASYARTVDGLPYLGPHRNFPHHLFAFGDASRSATGAYLASRVLLRHFIEEPEPDDRPFEFTRYVR
jgi:glycine/D-amino acid oxidase-like deaminating enzyme